MMRATMRVLLAVCLWAVGPRAFADVWDVSVVDDDDASNTDNEMVHGGRQVHDLAAVSGVPDQDWYRVVSFAYGSHEVVVEGTTGDIGPGYRLDRVTSGGGLIQAGVPIAGGSADSRSLRWLNLTTLGVTTTEFVRVARPDCAGACTASDQYSVRYYETTGSIIRFNNTGAQITVLMLQNPATYPISGRIYFWDPSGALLVPSPFTIAPKAEVTINSWTIPALVGLSGHITVAHDGRYGELNGAAIAIEPATGFSMLFPMVPRID